MAKSKTHSRRRAKASTATSSYPLEEAVKLVKARATAKFDETIELAINLGVDPRMPTRWCAAWFLCRTGPAARCASAVFAKGAKADEARRRAPISSAPKIWPSRSTRARSISTAASPRRT